MKKISVIFVITISLLNSGCFVKEKDLNQMLFPISLGITYENNKYKVYLQILDTSLVSIVETEISQSNTKFVLIHSEDENISKAFTLLNLKASSIISAIKLKSIVLHKSVFEEGKIEYSQLLQYFINNPIFRTQVQVFVTNTDIKDFYNIEYILTGSSIYTHANDEAPLIIKGFTKTAFVLDALKSYSDLNRMYQFPIIDVTTNKVDESIVEGELKNTTAYFYNGICYSTYNDKSIDCLNKEEASGSRWYNELRNMGIEVGDNETPINIVIKDVNCKKNIKDNHFNINVSLDAYINFNLTTYSINKISEQLNNKIKQDIYNTLLIAYNKDIDIYHLNDYAKRKDINLKYNPDNVSININSNIENTIYYKY